MYDNLSIRLGILEYKSWIFMFKIKGTTCSERGVFSQMIGIITGTKMIEYDH